MPDDVAAMDAAQLLAKRLLQERPELKNRAFAILVTNEEGEEICRIPLDIFHKGADWAIRAEIGVFGARKEANLQRC